METLCETDCATPIPTQMPNVVDLTNLSVSSGSLLPVIIAIGVVIVILIVAYRLSHPPVQIY